MSILIRGMKMPEYIGCYLLTIVYDAGGNMCAYPLEMMNGYDGRELLRDITEFPLVEVPTPHGDLIDRNELETNTKFSKNRWGSSTFLNYYSINSIKNAPTIIEAEGEKENEI